ncbi:MAG: hypothetical protein DWQ37_15450 [Planctomycetota bacterium]|nr:MAG: hypothetical protein DWQ37_15450 [Planctomycetota bacterium]
MRRIFFTSALALAALGVSHTAAQAAIFDEEIATPATAAPCQLPVTKVYRIKPGFCPQALVYMIPQAVGPSCCCGGCGPYGIPPIYASGQNVLVRQTPEVQERVTEFLTDLGALVVPKRAM